MPTWKFDLATFTGDAWAAPGDQTTVPRDRIARVNKSPIRYRASIRGGVEPGAPVTPDASTIDISVVKVVREPAYGFGESVKFTNYQLKSIAENSNPQAEQTPGEFSEFDVDPSDQVAIGVRSITVDGGVPPEGTKYLWVETGPGLEDAWPTPKEITGEAG